MEIGGVSPVTLRCYEVRPIASPFRNISRHRLGGDIQSGFLTELLVTSSSEIQNGVGKLESLTR